MAEETLYDSEAMRPFVRIAPGYDRIPDKTTILNFRAVTASVSASGPAIPADERDLVLRRLYRLEKSRTTKGTGLGLSLVKAVADLNGADMTLGDAGTGCGLRSVCTERRCVMPQTGLVSQRRF